MKMLQTHVMITSCWGSVTTVAMIGRAAHHGSLYLLYWPSQTGGLNSFPLGYATHWCCNNLNSFDFFCSSVSADIVVLSEWRRLSFRRILRQRLTHWAAVTSLFGDTHISQHVVQTFLAPEVFSFYAVKIMVTYKRRFVKLPQNYPELKQHIYESSHQLICKKYRNQLHPAS